MRSYLSLILTFTSRKGPDTVRSLPAGQQDQKHILIFNSLEITVEGLLACWLAERLHAPRAWPLLSAVKHFVFDSQIKTYIHFADFSRHVLIPNLTSGLTKSLYYGSNEMNSIFFFFFIITIMGFFFNVSPGASNWIVTAMFFFSLKSFRNFF